MKKRIYYNIFGILIFFSFAMTTFGQITEEKSASYSYPMTDDGQLHLTNMHGGIIIHGWDKDSVSVDIHIKVDTDEKNLLDRIQPDVDYSQEYLDVTTALEPVSTGFWRTLWNDINPIDIQRRDMKVNYEIYLPRGTDITLKNNYGDIDIEGCHGKLDATVEHGDIRISEEMRYVKANINFGKFRAHTLERGNITIRNGRLNLNEVNVLQLESVGTDIQLSTVTSLDLDSKNDDIEIDRVNTIKGEVRYGELVINELESFFDLRLHQNDCTIMALTSADAQLNVDQVSSDFELQSNGIGLNIVASMEAGRLRLPKEVDNLDVTMIDEKKEIREVRAQYHQSPFASLDITGKKGYIFIK